MTADMATLSSTLPRWWTRTLPAPRIDGCVNDHYEKLTRDKSRDDHASKIPERLTGTRQIRSQHRDIPTQMRAKAAKTKIAAPACRQRSARFQKMMIPQSSHDGISW
jgi:hypothetical protein